MARGYAKAEERNQRSARGAGAAGRGRAADGGDGRRRRRRPDRALDRRSATLAGVEVDGESPKLPQVLAPALIMGMMAWGMWRARYWAVLGFQLILVFLIFSAVFGLAVQAATVAQFAVTLGLLAVAGTFFFFMVKAMARIQMPERAPRE